MELEATCVSANADEVNAFDESAKEISFRQAFLRIGCSLPATFQMYEWSRNGKGLRMRDDWAIRFYYGKFRGKQCVCVFWSAIHHFFT